MIIEIHVPDGPTAQKAFEQMNHMEIFMSLKCNDDGVAVVILRNNKDTTVPLGCVSKNFQVLYERLSNEFIKDIIEKHNAQTEN